MGEKKERKDGVSFVYDVDIMQIGTKQTMKTCRKYCNYSLTSSFLVSTNN